MHRVVWVGGSRRVCARAQLWKGVCVYPHSSGRLCCSWIYNQHLDSERGSFKTPHLDPDRHNNTISDAQAYSPHSTRVCIHAQRHMQVPPTTASQQFDIINVFVTHHLLPSFPSPLSWSCRRGTKSGLFLALWPTSTQGRQNQRALIRGMWKESGHLPF